jgi:hypothetical protein
MRIAIYALTCAFASLCAAQPPPAPTITSAATDIKQLQFDITPVTRANWYELWFKANGGAQWGKYAQTPAQRPLIRINASVHLLDWTEARYYVKACNPGGCSQSNEVGINGEQLDAMGYFKPATSAPTQHFGQSFAVSADGTTLVALGTETINGVTNRASLHVFRKGTSTSGWRLETRLYPSPNNTGATASAMESIAISADGNTVVFGNLYDSSSGAVYLFHRAADGWHQTQRIAGKGAEDQFGTALELDSAGKTLVIEHNTANGVFHPGTLEVYQAASAGGNFTHAATIAAPVFQSAEFGYCRMIAMSDAGHIARSCTGTGNSDFFTQVFTQASGTPLTYTETAHLAVGTADRIAIDAAGERLAIPVMQQNGARVSVYRRNASGWTLERTLYADPLSGDISHLAMSGDGNFIAVGYESDNIDGLGPVFGPFLYTEETGSVAFYQRRATGWALRRVVKAGTDNVLHSFGGEVALDRSGKVLAVGSRYDPSNATGIDGNRENQSAPGRGAIWLY